MLKNPSITPRLGSDYLQPVYDEIVKQLEEEWKMYTDRMKAIDAVSDLYFTASLNHPNITIVFSDGQKLSFDPNTIDWDQLERTCVFWSEKCFKRQYELAGRIGTRRSYEDFKKLLLHIKHNRIANKMILSTNYGRC